MPTIYQKTTKKANPMKFKKVMKEYSEGTLHSGSTGKIVSNPKQAQAIAYSEARRKKLKR